MKQDKTVCDVCGKEIRGEPTVLLLTLHPPKGFAQKVRVDLCSEHAATTWADVKHSVGQ